jgi:toxin YoeB
MTKPKRSAPAPTRTEWKCLLDRTFIEDLAWWAGEQPKIAVKLIELMRHIIRDPQGGVGKPERLRHLGPNIWSRRLTQEHRVIYLVKDEAVHFLQARYHYE